MPTFPRALGQLRTLVEDRARRLRSLSVEELRALDSDAPEIVSVEGRRAEILTIVEAMPGERLRVVLQGSMKARLLPGSHMAVSGFYKSHEGTIEELSDSDVYEFA